MDSPVAAIFAHFSWSTMKINSQSKAQLIFKPVSYFRYVDDPVTIFDNPDHATNYIDYSNQQHGDITFTLKTKATGTLPFLDCVISKQNNCPHLYTENQHSRVQKHVFIATRLATLRPTQSRPLYILRIIYPVPSSLLTKR